jgi:uncharacterized protein (TIGR02246 family)
VRSLRGALGLFIVFAPLLLLPACAKQEAPSAVQALTVRAAIDSLWAGYARASDQKDAAAFGQLFTEDATLARSNAPTVRGREDIQRYLAATYKDVDPTGLRVESEDTMVAGSTAVQTGMIQERFAENGGERTTYGRYVVVASQESDGAWRIRRLFGIADSTTGPLR